MPTPSASASLVGIVASGSTAALSQAPALAMAMTYAAMADSIGLEMANAVANQQRGQVISGTAVAKLLALIIVKGSSGT